MGWIVSMILAVVVFVALKVIGKALLKSEDKEIRPFGKVLAIAAWLILCVWVAGHTVVSSFYQIPAGNTGIVYKFGAIKGQISEGFQAIAPWSKAVLANTQVQRHKFTGEKQLFSFSQETQTVFVQASLNIKVNPDAIQGLYRTVGQNYFETLVEPRVAQNFKDEIVKYKSVDIAPNREQIRNAVRDRLERELAAYSIEVVDLLLDNVDFRDEFENAIEAKQIATQRALEEEQKVIVERHRASQMVERAIGEGGAILTLATKQAEANEKLSQSLTPELIQYTMIQKLSDKIQVIILPQGQNFILSPELLKQKPE